MIMRALSFYIYIYLCIHNPLYRFGLECCGKALGAVKQGLGETKQDPETAKHALGAARQGLGKARQGLGTAKQSPGEARHGLDEAK